MFLMLGVFDDPQADHHADHAGPVKKENTEDVNPAEPGKRLWETATEQNV